MATKVTDVPEAGHLPQGPFKCHFNPKGMSPEGCRHLTSVRMKNLEGCVASCCDSPYRACVDCLLTGSEPAPVDDNDSGKCRFHKTHPPGTRRPRRSFDLSVEDLDVEWRRAIARRASTATVLEEPRKVVPRPFSRARVPGMMRIYNPKTKEARWVTPLEALDIALPFWDPNMRVLDFSETLHITPSRAYSLLTLQHLETDVAKQLRAAPKSRSITILHALSRLCHEVQRQLVPGVLAGTVGINELNDLRRDRANRITTGA